MFLKKVVTSIETMCSLNCAELEVTRLEWISNWSIMDATCSIFTVGKWVRPALIANRAWNSPNAEVKINKSPSRTLILPAKVTSETQQLSSTDECVTRFPSRTLILPSTPKRREQTSPAITEAAGIMEEEVGSSCHICSDRILENETSCDKCQNSCHRIRSVLDSSACSKFTSK